MRDTVQPKCAIAAGARLAPLVSLLALAISTPCSAQGIALRPAVEALYSSVSIYPPSATSMTVCYGFVCRRRHVLDFTPGDRVALTQLLNAGHGNAAAERAAVQKAVVWFDRRMGPVLGTSKRVAKADFRYFDDKHNFDCWDTTRNVTSLLLVLQDWGLLKYHAVGDPHYRGNALVLQTPHNTPVLVDRASHIEWVVDMWTRGYAQMPLPRLLVFCPKARLLRNLWQEGFGVRRTSSTQSGNRFSLATNAKTRLRGDHAQNKIKRERARRLSGRTQSSEMSGKPHSRIASESAATDCALGARP